MPDDDRALEFLFFMALFYPLLAWAIFPVRPEFIFRERAFGIVLPYFYILLARFVASRGTKMLLIRLKWLPTIPALILSTFIIRGIVGTLQEGFWPTDLGKRAQLDARALIRERGLGNEDWLRGDTVLDGVAMVEWFKYKHPSKMTGYYLLSSRPLEGVFARHETLSYLGFKNQNLKVRAIAGKGSVILYAISS